MRDLLLRAPFLILLASCAGTAAPGDTGTLGDSANMQSDGDSTDTSMTGDDAMTDPDAAVTDDGVPPVACTAGTHWTRGNLGSQYMNPGLPCIACHSISRGAPRFSFAGTVYPSVHEEDLCNGQSAVTVEVTDAAGRVVRAITNSAGNFYSQTAVSFPIRARVLQGGREAHMLDPQTTGDCNSCHTRSGTTGAPGRITAP